MAKQCVVLIRGCLEVKSRDALRETQTDAHEKPRFIAKALEFG